MESQHTLAAVLIVKNEAEHLRACLASVHDWVDEIVVLDAGSVDRSMEIAEEFGAKVYRNDQWPGFGRQRQNAQRHVAADWCLWLDADERVLPQLRNEILATVRQGVGKTAYAFPRLNWFFGRYIRHCGWYPKPVVRLYPTKLTQYNDALVHEEVIVTKEMSVSVFTGDLLHYPYKNLQHYIKKSSYYAHEWARSRFDSGKKVYLFSAVIHSIGKFFRMYFLKFGFLDGNSGFLLCVLSSYYVFLKYAELWTMQQDMEKNSNNA